MLIIDLIDAVLVRLTTFADNFGPEEILDVIGDMIDRNILTTVYDNEELITLTQRATTYKMVVTKANNIRKSHKGDLNSPIAKLQKTYGSDISAYESYMKEEIVLVKETFARKFTEQQYMQIAEAGWKFAIQNPVNVDKDPKKLDRDRYDAEADVFEEMISQS
jgi:hypothetical protein